MGEANSTPVRGAPLKGSPSQQWRLDPGKDGNALITSRMGRTLDISGGATRDGVRVQTYEVNGDSNQRFSFRRIADLPRVDRDRDRESDRDRDDWDRDRRWERYHGRYDEGARRWGMEGDGVCFYREEGYCGRSFCIRAGEEVARVPEPLTDHRIGEVLWPRAWRRGVRRVRFSAGRACASNPIGPPWGA